MKEIVIDEILYEGHRYQLDKPLTLKVKEVKEVKEEPVEQDNNYSEYFNEYNYSYKQTFDPWKYSVHGYDNDYTYNYGHADCSTPKEDK